MSETGALQHEELKDAWPVLSRGERMEAFRLLPFVDGDEFFLTLSAREQAELLLMLDRAEQRSRIRLLAPDDVADVLQRVGDAAERERLFSLLDDGTRREVAALLAYAEDDAGGLMSPRYARVRPDMGIDEAISYLRKQAREKVETIHYAYALDAEQRLVGVVSFRDLFSADPGRLVRDVMQTELVTVPEEMDQEAVSRLFQEHFFLALPVVDKDGRIKGIVTLDDIVDVVQEEATEDIQKVGGMEALDAPYFDIGLPQMIRKRGVWLTVLFLGETLTATAMSYFESEIDKAVVLALFVPLIISSGGNSGSQASTLVIRAMALGEIRLRDWWRVIRRELAAGLLMGLGLGLIGLLRIVIWQTAFQSYGPYFIRVGLVVAVSLVGVVMWGTLSGAMLPFALRRLGFDPASASAPFVATLVDVSGLVIYFSAASLFLKGTLL